MPTVIYFVMFVCFNQKTAYELRISDWSSDVCSSDLERQAGLARRGDVGAEAHLLGLARRMLVEIVEPGLADADHLVVAGQLDQPLGRLLALLDLKSVV